MGNGLSAEERRDMERKDMEEFGRHISEGQNLRINETIKMFTSLESSDNLTQHYEKRKMETGGGAPDWVKSLVEQLGALTPAPELAGLGALAIAIIIDSNSSSPPEESAKEALRCVFAEEKASEVRVHINECLKRCVMYIKNKAKLVGEIERIEVQLSAAITRLKDSMVSDGHMRPEALKAWVNGAAFHIQVLIHLVRLGGIQSRDTVKRLISTYLSDLDLLFKEHRELIRGKCKKELGFAPIGSDLLDNPWEFYMVDDCSESYEMSYCLTFEQYCEVYYDRRYFTQKLETQTYFSDVRRNLQQLVDQRGSFNVVMSSSSSGWCSSPCLYFLLAALVLGLSLMCFRYES
ncbi:uncharacterized protein LOC115578162 [Sparus aurata]|uniref:uncharacterized protein LOC115578162 n=1 Tax=Sparus aurata TaxID=8175 RepID=UPI0011C1CD0D|nr:uncharacterized protein LOC115578162 [Sparus aurata]XP_030266873.1 uncharacterized protein LOC115578162 [Sparus aurata]XP_030266874.1 uncharacterized protein LOC115578162 [Sparus aurata]XP_030266875.1 uncharacterized protein LOC115578162 [Sparus aurata]